MRLLIAEDDPDLARQLIKALADAGYTIDHAGNGEEAHHLGVPSVECEEEGRVGVDLPVEPCPDTRIGVGAFREQLCRYLHAPIFRREVEGRPAFARGARYTKSRAPHPRRGPHARFAPYPGEGKTPLHFAAASGHDEVVGLLLARKVADVNERTRGAPRLFTRPRERAGPRR